MSFTFPKCVWNQNNILGTIVNVPINREVPSFYLKHNAKSTRLCFAFSLSHHISLSLSQCVSVATIYMLPLAPLCGMNIQYMPRIVANQQETTVAWKWNWCSHEIAPSILRPFLFRALFWSRHRSSRSGWNGTRCRPEWWLVRFYHKQKKTQSEKRTFHL